MARIRVHVIPKASLDEIAGWRGEALVVRVSVAPEKGKANSAAACLVAQALGVSKSAAQVVVGQHSRNKVIEIEGVDDDRVQDAFGTPDSSRS